MEAARRRDAVNTRARILATAREQFSLAGYDRTTVRSIAAAAGVSANLITRYFGGKQGLFDEATEVDLRVADALPGPDDRLGHRIAEHVVTRWEGRPGDDPLVTMLRAAMSDPEAAARLARFLARQTSAPLVAHLATPDAAGRAAAVGVVIMGLITQRYVLRAGPVAHADPQHLSAWLGDVLQGVLAGPPTRPLPAAAAPA